MMDCTIGYLYHPQGPNFESLIIPWTANVSIFLDLCYKLIYRQVFIDPRNLVKLGFIQEISRPLPLYVVSPNTFR